MQGSDSSPSRSSGIPVLTIIILTKNEEMHLARLFASFDSLDAEFCIVDSFSDDNTIGIAKKAAARVFQNPFVSQAAQFQWALENCNINTPWIMRMDADEYLTPELAIEISHRLHDIPHDVNGIVIKRKVYFMGKWIRYGGYYPIRLLRIWRNGHARIEQRWMDEHIALTSGRTVEFKHDIIDDNANNLTWWTEKHNAYATREAVDMLNRRHCFLNTGELQEAVTDNRQKARKRWFKDNIYSRMPLFIRAFFYFIYRYVFTLGFLDGRRGLIWHFLQGCWYRFLVDAKIVQIRWWARKENLSIRQVIEEKYHLKL